VEEVSKYLLIRFFGLKRGVAPRSAYALVLYGMAAAVGFAAVEVPFAAV
jgi:RsiW-degrading membrane proteinase PrsW (M82 family)